MNIKPLIAGLLLSIGALPAAAQNHKHADKSAYNQAENLSPDEKARKEAAKMKEMLGLSEDQAKKWEGATMDRINANAPLQEKMKGSTTPEERQELREQMKKNKTSFDTQVSAFLTPEQQKKLQERKEHHHKKKGDLKGQ